jgi:hypothetical protein
VNLHGIAGRRDGPVPETGLDRISPELF